MSADRLAEIKARADAATEGPWVRDMHSPDMSGRPGWHIRGPRKLGLRSMVLNSRMLPGDAEFIEHAREDVPWLVERVRELIGDAPVDPDAELVERMARAIDAEPGFNVSDMAYAALRALREIRDVTPRAVVSTDQEDQS